MATPFFAAGDTYPTAIKDGVTSSHHASILTESLTNEHSLALEFELGCSHPGIEAFPQPGNDRGKGQNTRSFWPQDLEDKATLDGFRWIVGSLFFRVRFSVSYPRNNRADPPYPGEGMSKLCRFEVEAATGMVGTLERRTIVSAPSFSWWTTV